MSFAHREIDLAPEHPSIRRFQILGLGFQMLSGLGVEWRSEDLCFLEVVLDAAQNRTDAILRPFGSVSETDMNLDVPLPEIGW